MPRAKKAVTTRRTTAAAKPRSEFVRIQDVKLEVEHRGRGRPLLVLPGEEGLEADAPVIDELAKKYEVIMLWPPGFGRSTRPDSIRTMDDISYLYLEYLDRFDLRRVPVIGFSMGGWIAAEMASKDCARLSKMILVNAFGIKLGGAYDRDIADIWFLPPDQVNARKYHQPEKWLPDFKTMADRKVQLYARHRESTARFCWEPYMHNPSLRLRLARIRIPSLVLWGAGDGIVTPAYGKAYAKSIPGAKFKTIPRAGHLPHIEQKDAFLKQAFAFLSGKK